MEQGDKPQPTPEKPELDETSQAVKDTFLRLKNAVIEIRRKNPLLLATDAESRNKLRKSPKDNLPFPLNQQGIQISFEYNDESISLMWYEGNNKRVIFEIGTWLSTSPSISSENWHYFITHETRGTARNDPGFGYGEMHTSAFAHGDRWEESREKFGKPVHMSKPKKITLGEWTNSEDKTFINSIVQPLEEYSKSLPEPRKNFFGRVFRRGAR